MSVSSLNFLSFYLFDFVMAYFLNLVHFFFLFSSQGSSLLDITSGGNMKVSTLCFLFYDTDIKSVDLLGTMSCVSFP